MSLSSGVRGLSSRYIVAYGSLCRSWMTLKHFTENALLLPRYLSLILLSSCNVKFEMCICTSISLCAGQLYYCIHMNLWIFTHCHLHCISLHRTRVSFFSTYCLSIVQRTGLLSQHLDKDHRLKSTKVYRRRPITLLVCTVTVWANALDFKYQYIWMSRLVLQLINATQLLCIGLKCAYGRQQGPVWCIAIVHQRRGCSNVKIFF